MTISTFKKLFSAFQNRRKLLAGVLVVGVFVSVAAIVLPHFTYAQTDLYSGDLHEGAPNILANPIGDPVKASKSSVAGDVVDFGLAGITKAVQWLASGLFEIIGSVLQFGFTVLTTVIKYSDFKNIPIVNIGWQIGLNFVNLLFILILLVIGFATIFRQETYGLKALLPRLIIIALLINFSKVIAGVILDIGNLLTYFFLNPIEGKEAGMGTLIMNLLNLNKTLDPNLAQLAAAGAGASFNLLLGTIAGMVLALVAAIGVFLYALTFIVRIVMIWFLIILAPFAWICYILPGTRKYWSQWWDQFICWTFVAPVMMFFLYLLAAYGQTANSFGLTGTMAAINPTKFSEIYPNCPSAFLCDPRFVLQYAVIMMIIYAGPFAAKQMSCRGSAAALNVATAGMNWARGTFSGYNAGKRVYDRAKQVWKETRPTPLSETFGKNIGMRVAGLGAYAHITKKGREEARQKVQQYEARQRMEKVNKAAELLNDYTPDKLQRIIDGLDPERTTDTDKAAARKVLLQNHDYFDQMRDVVADAWVKEFEIRESRAPDPEESRRIRNAAAEFARNERNDLRGNLDAFYKGTTYTRPTGRMYTYAGVPPYPGGFASTTRTTPSPGGPTTPSPGGPTPPPSTTPGPRRPTTPPPGGTTTPAPGGPTTPSPGPTTPPPTTPGPTPTTPGPTPSPTTAHPTTPRPTTESPTTIPPTTPPPTASSFPTDTWISRAGVKDEVEAREWDEAMKTGWPDSPTNRVTMARAWHSAGFTPEQAKEFIEKGIADPDEVPSTPPPVSEPPPASPTPEPEKSQAEKEAIVWAAVRSMHDDTNNDRAEKIGFANDVEELFAQGLYSDEIAERLKSQNTRLKSNDFPINDIKKMVNAVKAKRGIPDRSGVREIFDKWTRDRAKKKQSPSKPEPENEPRGPAPEPKGPPSPPLGKSEGWGAKEAEKHEEEMLQMQYARLQKRQLQKNIDVYKNAHNGAAPDTEAMEKLREAASQFSEKQILAQRNELNENYSKTQPFAARSIAYIAFRDRHKKDADDRNPADREEVENTARKIFQGDLSVTPDPGAYSHYVVGKGWRPGENQEKERALNAVRSVLRMKFENENGTRPFDRSENAEQLKANVAYDKKQRIYVEENLKQMGLDK